MQFFIRTRCKWENRQSKISNHKTDRSARSSISLRVFDHLGREVGSLLRGENPTGTHEVVFDAKNLPGGVYHYRLEGRGFSQTKMMTLVR